MKIPYKIRMVCWMGKNLAMWILFTIRNPLRIRFFPEWVFSFWPGRAAYKEGIPWITFEAREWLQSYLTKEKKVFEWGTGGSTLFLARRSKALVSLEHDSGWHKKIGDVLKNKGISNCQYLLKEPCPGNEYLSSSPRYRGMSFKEYCAAIDSYPDEFFDLVLIDGRARNFCIPRAIKKIRPQGFLLLDDSDGPGYAEGAKFIKNWKRSDFRGPKPYVKDFYQTSIWQKPAL